VEEGAGRLEKAGGGWFHGGGCGIVEWVVEVSEFHRALVCVSGSPMS
jgi:hypothetical protein